MSFVYVAAHIMCSFEESDGEAHHIVDVSIIIALVHDDDNDLIAICY